MKRDIISTPWSDLPISKEEGEKLRRKKKKNPLRYSLEFDSFKGKKTP